MDPSVVPVPALTPNIPSPAFTRNVVPSPASLPIVPISQPSAVAGPGPSTLAARTAKISAPSRVKKVYVELKKAPKSARKLADLDAEGNEDVQMEEVEKIVAEEMKRKMPLRGMKGKGKAVMRNESDEESPSSSSTDENDKAIYYHARRPPASATKATKPPKSHGVVTRPTGEEHVPACSRCESSKIKCEKDGNGGACVTCKVRKQKCDYALPASRRKKVTEVRKRVIKSKARVDTDDDGQTEENERMVIDVPDTPELSPSALLLPGQPTPRPLRIAQARARIAVKKTLAGAPQPSKPFGFKTRTRRGPDGNINGIFSPS